MMLTTGWSNTNNIRLPLISTNAGDKSQWQQQQQRQQQQQKQLHQQKQQQQQHQHQQQQQHEPLVQEISHRPSSNNSTQSIDNAYSLEHLFIALRRRIKRIVQTYNVKAFHETLNMCARLFKSYASYNLNTIDEFARRLNKNIRDNKKVITVIDQFRLQLAELRHCHSTFESELLVTTLAIDFHEDESEQMNKTTTLPLSKGKFSPRSRLSKVRGRYVRQATEFKTQLKKINEQIQILLYDEFYANISTLWDESEKYVSAAIQFHDHHMTYVLRLIPDIVLKFEYALQLCTKLFDLETTMLETYSQTNHFSDNNNNNNNYLHHDLNHGDSNDNEHHNHINNNNNNTDSNHDDIHNDNIDKNHTTNNNAHINTIDNIINNNNNNHHHHDNNANVTSYNRTTPITTITITPRSDYNQQQESNEVILEENFELKKSNRTTRKTSNFFSADVTTNSSASSDVKLLHANKKSISLINHDQPFDIGSQHDDNPIFPPLFPTSVKPVNHKNDQTKLQILIEQLDKRLIDEEIYRKRLLNCVQQASKKSEQLNRFPKNNMLTLVLSNEPAVTEYQKGLYSRDYQVHKSVTEEINVALRETQHRIDWINMVRQRAFQCFRQ